MNTHRLAVPESLDSLHMQNQNLLGLAGREESPHRKHVMERVEPLGAIKLVMGNGRNAGEVSDVRFCTSLRDAILGGRTFEAKVRNTVLACRWVK